MIYLVKLAQTLINKETDNVFKMIGLIITSCIILLFGLILHKVLYYTKPNNKDVKTETNHQPPTLRIVK